jgi:hypothetical protein
MLMRIAPKPVQTGGKMAVQLNGGAFGVRSKTLINIGDLSHPLRATPWYSMT